MDKRPQWNSRQRVSGLQSQRGSNHGSPQVKIWDRDALRDYTYLITDKGPMNNWLWRMDNRYGQIQNATHLMHCSLIADEKGRNKEEIEQDREWCAAVYRFLKVTSERKNVFRNRDSRPGVENI